MVKNGPHTFHFKFQEISLDQFKPDRTYQLVCTNNPLCKCRILIKSIFTTDVKSEDFDTFENWEIVPPKRISSFKPHNCNGPIQMEISLKPDEISIASIESVVGHLKKSQLIFSIKINDEKFDYGCPIYRRIEELFTPTMIYCVNYPACGSFVRIYATDTVDPADKDFYTQRNWVIWKFSEKTHLCFLPNFPEILRLKKEEMQTKEAIQSKRRNWAKTKGRKRTAAEVARREALSKRGIKKWSAFEKWGDGSKYYNFLAWDKHMRESAQPRVRKVRFITFREIFVG